MAAQTLQPNPSEYDLVLRVLAGDRSAFFSLLRPYERIVFLAAHALLQNDSDAELAAQEALVSVMQKLPQFRSEQRFAAWLLGVAVQEIHAWTSEHRPLVASSLAATSPSEDEYLPRNFESWQDLANRALATSELRRTFQRAFSSLSAPCRQILILRDTAGLTVPEISRILDVSGQAARARLHRARLQMRDAMAPGSCSNSPLPPRHSSPLPAGGS